MHSDALVWDKCSFMIQRKMLVQLNSSKWDPSADSGKEVGRELRMLCSGRTGDKKRASFWLHKTGKLREVYYNAHYKLAPPVKSRWGFVKIFSVNFSGKNSVIQYVVGDLKKKIPVKHSWSVNAYDLFVFIALNVLPNSSPFFLPLPSSPPNWLGNCAWETEGQTISSTWEKC